MWNMAAQLINSALKDRNLPVFAICGIKEIVISFIRATLENFFSKIQGQSATNISEVEYLILHGLLVRRKKLFLGCHRWQRLTDFGLLMPVLQAVLPCSISEEQFIWFHKKHHGNTISKNLKKDKKVKPGAFHRIDTIHIRLQSP